MNSIQCSNPHEFIKTQGMKEMIDYCFYNILNETLNAGTERPAFILDPGLSDSTVLCSHMNVFSYHQSGDFNAIFCK